MLRTFIPEADKQALYSFGKKFPIGCKVMDVEIIKKGWWYNGHKTTKELKHVNRGEVIEYKLSFGEPQAKIKLTSGYLFDLDQYDHDHVWSSEESLTRIS